MSTGKNTIKFEANVGDEWLPSIMKNMYIPNIRGNLFSVTSALDNGLSFRSSKTSCEFLHWQCSGIRRGRLFRMLIQIRELEVIQINEVNLVSEHSLQIWHERVGHQNKRHVQRFLMQNGIAVNTNDELYGACAGGKQQRSSFSSRF